MKISTKVECGIIALIDIALNSEEGKAVSIAGISERQDISAKYLEQILIAFRQANLIKGQKGSRGGYTLSNKAENITFKEILNALDGTILSDVEEDKSSFPGYRSVLKECLWDRMNAYLVDFAENTTLKDIAEKCRSQTDNGSFMYYI